MRRVGVFDNKKIKMMLPRRRKALILHGNVSVLCNKKKEEVLYFSLAPNSVPSSTRE
jgi:hypothetical protein